MEVKLSSARIISEADLATAVPLPMAIPISAFFRAGASLTPSPVMAVISSMLCRYSTILDLWKGSTLANMRAFLQPIFCSEGGEVVELSAREGVALGPLLLGEDADPPADGGGGVLVVSG